MKYFVEQTNAIEGSHQFWLDNKDKVVIGSNRGEIEAAANASKKGWLSSLTSLFEEETTQQRVRSDKIEKFITETPFVEINSHRGTYVWGDTGSGKTFLCDLFFDNLNIKEKQRFHYNKFMLNIHQSNFRYYNVG